MHVPTERPDMSLSDIRQSFVKQVSQAEGVRNSRYRSYGFEPGYICSITDTELRYTILGRRVGGHITIIDEAMPIGLSLTLTVEQLLFLPDRSYHESQPKLVWVRKPVVFGPPKGIVVRGNLVEISFGSTHAPGACIPTPVTAYFHCLGPRIGAITGIMIQTQPPARFADIFRETARCRENHHTPG